MVAGGYRDQRTGNDYDGYRRCCWRFLLAGFIQTGVLDTGLRDHLRWARYLARRQPRASGFSRRFRVNRGRGAAGRRAHWQAGRLSLTSQYRNTAQKCGEIVGDVIDVRGIASGELPLFAQHHLRALRNDQNRRHPERMRHFEVAREILKDRGAACIDEVSCQEALVNAAARLWLERGGPDVEDIVEVALDP